MSSLNVFGWQNVSIAQMSKECVKLDPSQSKKKKKQISQATPFSTSTDPSITKIPFFSLNS